MDSNLKQLLETIYKYKSYIITSGIAVAFILCIAGSRDRMIATMIMGFFTALAAFIGVAYAQDKQNDFLNRQIKETKHRQDEKIQSEIKQKSEEYRLAKEEEFYISLLTYRHYLLSITKLYRLHFSQLNNNDVSNKESYMQEIESNTLKMRENWYKVKFLQAKFEFIKADLFSSLKGHCEQSMPNLLSETKDIIDQNLHKDYEYIQMIINKSYKNIGVIFNNINEDIETALAYVKSLNQMK